MDYFNVPASIQTSEHARANGANPVTRDPSFAIYQNKNAILVLDILTAYRAGNLEPLLKRLHPDVSWRSLSEPQHARFGGLFRGRDAVKTFFRRLSDSLAMEEYRVIDVIPAGHETISVAECFVHVAGDPARKACIRLVNVWTFAGGIVTAMTEYFNVPAYRAQLKLD
jgi:ketosteroid isomerase-like protein